MRRVAGASLLLALLLGPPAAAAAPDIEGQASALAALRARLGAIEEAIAEEQQRARRLDADLAGTAERAASLAAEAARLQAEAEAALARVRELDAEVERRSASTEQHRRNLARLLRAAYRDGEQTHIKLVLNQDDPGRLARVLVYQRHLANDRSRRLAEASAAVTALAGSRRALAREAEALSASRALALAAVEALEAERAQASAQRAEVARTLEERAIELARLRREEADLEALLADLKARQQAAAATPAKPFAQLAGKLAWPVRGAILRGFGSSHDSGDFRSHGVVLGTDAAAEVRAISAGKVVFAGEFKHLGLLVIVDHGGGYMSLYGYNETLYTQAGAQVAAGAVIARTGAVSSGRQASLYFEVRHSGKPVDPARWCSMPATQKG